MSRHIFLSGALLANAAFASVSAQGDLGVLAQGQYICALPGDATGVAWTEQPGAAFTVTSSSTYKTGDGAGSYLLEGHRLTFTRGPMRGKTFLMLGNGLLQETGKDKQLGRLRCHRSGSVN